MKLFSQLERIATEGGYNVAGRRISRVSVADIHRLHAGLARLSGGTIQEASLAVAQLRRWMVHGDGRLPPVRGAGYLHANREVWMAYTEVENSAVLRGRPSILAELRHCLAMSANPDYHGFLKVKTNPQVEIGTDGESVMLTSKAGVATLSLRDAAHVDHWISISMTSKDRRGVLCLPTQWSPV